MQGLICLNGDIIRKDTINQMPPGNAKSLMDSVFDLAQRINRFQLSDAEIGLFCAVVIITPGKFILNERYGLKMTFLFTLNHKMCVQALQMLPLDTAGVHSISCSPFCTCLISFDCGVRQSASFIGPLLADRPGLRNAELVQRMQSKLKMVFNSILLPKHSDHASIFSELMTMIHDLRTLNTLHTEKFLQQCKIQPNSTPPPPGAQQSQQPTSTNWHNPQQVERESTGNASPQSSSSDDGGGSSNSSNRRSPISSVSSSGESICSNEVSKLTHHGDIKVSGNVLLNALTVADQAAAAAAAAAAASAAPSSAATVTTVSRKRVAAAPTAEEPKAATGTAAATVTKHKVRKLDSPSDSGIDSPKAGASHGSHSTNTSVCSSPRSSSTEDDARNKAEKSEKAEKACPPSSSSSSAPAAGNPAGPSAAAAAPAVEEQHPLLKRALEQPPQPYNEVYRPHKKFRRHNIPVGDDLPSSTSTNQASPHSPPPAAHCSLLVSQLSEPPLSHRPGQQHSLLASTLNAPIASSRESMRNEYLAKLILSHPPQPPPSAPGGAASQGLLMCAKPAAVAAEAAGTSQPPPPSRHIPVQAAPTKPSSSSSSAASKMSQLAAAAAAVESSSSTTASSQQSEAQPLNLSTRTPPPPASNDIPTEA